MSMIGVAVGPALVGLALLLAARHPDTRGRSGGLVFALTPLALLSITIPLFVGARQFIDGLQKLASQQRGGVPVVAPLCLGIARPLLFGTIVSLVSIVVVAVFQVCWPPAGSPRGAAERQKASPWYFRLLLVAGSGLAIPVGVLVFLGQKVASFTMLVVDPAKKEEAMITLAGMDAQRVSGSIAGTSAMALHGSLALSALLLVFGIVGVLVWRLNGEGHVLWGYSWLFLLVVTMSAAWGIFQLQSDVSWYNSAGHSSLLSEGSMSPSEKTVESFFRRASRPPRRHAHGSSSRL